MTTYFFLRKKTSINFAPYPTSPPPHLPNTNMRNKKEENYQRANEQKQLKRKEIKQKRLRGVYVCIQIPFLFSQDTKLRPCARDVDLVLV